jgi:hypothetical protein
MNLLRLIRKGTVGDIDSPAFSQIYDGVFLGVNSEKLLVDTHSLC